MLACTLGGVSIVLESESAELLDGLRPLIAPFDRADYEPVVRCRVKKVLSAPHDCTQNVMVTPRGKGVWQIEAPQAFATVDSTSGEAVVEVLDGGNVLKRVVRVLFAHLLPLYGGVLVHSGAACRCRQGPAVVYPGVSGSGKSTLTDLLEGAGWEVLGDEIVVIRKTEGTWRVYATPFRGKARSADEALSSGIARILSLKKGSMLSLTPWNKADAAAQVLRSVLHFGGGVDNASLLLDIVSDLVESTATHTLEFSLTSNPAEVL